MLIITSVVALMLTANSAHSVENEFLVLCYHDVPLQVKNDTAGVSVRTFIGEIEYMRTHGYTFIGMDQVREANRGKLSLPEKSVMLTFDDAYISFYSNVVPILEIYNLPAVLAICSSWMGDGPPKDIVAPLMSWQQAKEMVEHPLVTVASHSHDLHKALQYNPQGNTGHVGASRLYDPRQKRYETEVEYRKRVFDDLSTSSKTMAMRTGRKPDVLVWP